MPRYHREIENIFEKIDLILTIAGIKEQQALRRNKLADKLADIGKINALIDRARSNIDYLSYQVTPDEPRLKALQRRVENLNGRVYKHLNELPLKKSPNTDPAMEKLKDAPKPPSENPFMATEIMTKITSILKEVFGENQFVQPGSILPAIQNLNSVEKKLFFVALSRKILDDGHVALNNPRILAQLALSTVGTDLKQYRDIMNQENHERKILNMPNVPTDKLPIVKVDQPPREEHSTIIRGKDPRQQKIEDFFKQVQIPTGEPVQKRSNMPTTGLPRGKVNQEVKGKPAEASPKKPLSSREDELNKLLNSAPNVPTNKPTFKN